MGSLHRVFLGISLFGSLSSQAALKMEVFGDSISAGFLTHTSIAASPKPKDMAQVMRDFSVFLATKERDLIHKYERRDLAWPAVLQQTLVSEGLEIEAPQNLAVTGGWTSQMTEVLKTRPEEGAATWAFFFVGHNDLCHVDGTADDARANYVRNYDEALREWDARHHGSKAYVITVSPVYRLYASLGGYAWSQSSSGKALRCDETWTRYFPYCTHYYQKHQRGELESYLKPRVDKMNEGLKELAEGWNQKTTRQNEYVYLDVSRPDKLLPQWISFDCYHISEEGQKHLAESVREVLRP